MQGQYIGTAPVMVAARADADDSVPELQRQLGLRSRVVAEEHRRLMPAIRQQLKMRNEAMKTNIAEMGLEDPVEIVAAEAYGITGSTASVEAILSSIRMNRLTSCLALTASWCNGNNRAKQKHPKTWESFRAVYKSQFEEV